MHGASPGQQKVTVASSLLPIDTDLDKVLQLDSISTILSLKYDGIPSYLKKHILLRSDLLGYDEAEQKSTLTNSSMLSREEPFHQPYVSDTAMKAPSVPYKLQQLHLPFDPFADFEWMDDSYCSFNNASSENMGQLNFATASASRSCSSIGDGISVGSGILSYMMPEFIEWEKKEEIPKHFTSEYLRKLDLRSETVLIQRIWRGWLLIENSQSCYQKRRRSMEDLSYDIRSILRCLSLQMHRLRFLFNSFFISLNYINAFMLL